MTLREHVLRVIRLATSGELAHLDDRQAWRNRAEEHADAILALLPALPPGEPTDDEVRDWAYNTLATDTDGDTRGVWWSTITPARKGMYRRAMLSARPSPPATLWEREPDTDEWRSQGHETQVISE